MPIRSPYQIEQYEAALQKLAHKIPKFRKVRSEELTIEFYYDDEGKPKKISVTHHKKTGRKDQWDHEEIEYWGFTIEKKLYTTSSDACKIECSDYEVDRVKKWLEEVMGSEKPMPRFKLSDIPGQKRLHEAP